MATSNLFKKAEAKGATAAAKKNDKEEVIIDDQQFHATLARLAEVNAEIDTLSAESAVLGATVKERAIKEFTQLYQKKMKFPGSFIIRAVAKTLKSASLMFIAADKYISINEERAEELKKAYGEEIIEKKTTYIMDSALVEKHGEVISNLIEKCKLIPDDDKEKLISAVVKFEVKKGTLSDLSTKYAAIPMNEILQDIRPIYSLKNVKIDE